MDLKVAGGYVLHGGRVVEADVGVDGSEIREIGDVGDADRVVDADGSLVLPGLVNSHTHVSMSLMRGYADDLPLDTWLEEKIWPVEAELTDDDIYLGAKLGILEMVKSGTTCFNDMYFSMDRVADAVTESGIRACLGMGMIAVGKSDDEIKEELEEGVGFAERYGGEDRIKTTVAPHAPYTCSEWLLESASREAESLDVPLHIHLSETEGEVDDMVEGEGVRPPRYLDELGCLDGSIAAHCVHIDDAEIEVLSKRGVGVAHCPNANMKLASGVAPVSRMLEKDVSVGIGTDGPVSNNNLDMFEEIRNAALLSKVESGDARVLPARQVLDMATRTGNSILGFGSGEIKKGGNADLIVVDLDAPHLNPHNDLVSHAVYSAKGSDVSTTIVDGRVLMENREVETMDEKKVIREASEAARELIERAEK